MATRRTLLAATAALPALALTPHVSAAAGGDPIPGTPVQLRETRHLYIVGEDGRLHWGGDTRALLDKQVFWDKLKIWPYRTISRQSVAPLGDPWLSAGLLKDGDPIYLVKWEHDWEQPKLLHIPSIRDVEIFGINTSNYGRFVMDKATWETKYGFKVADLEHGTLQPATWGRWRGHPRGHSQWRGKRFPDEADWPSIVLNWMWPVLGFACQRGTDRWAAMFPWTGDLTTQHRDEPKSGHPRISYAMPGVAGPTDPQLWRGGHVWATGWSFEFNASFTDIPERPYARQLLDTIIAGIAQGQYDLTVTWQQNGREWSRTLDVSGFEAALAWLRVECARETPVELPSGWTPDMVVCPRKQGRLRANRIEAERCRV